MHVQQLAALQEVGILSFAPHHINAVTNPNPKLNPICNPNPNTDPILTLTLCMEAFMWCDAKTEESFGG